MIGSPAVYAIELNKPLTTVGASSGLLLRCWLPSRVSGMGSHRLTEGVTPIMRGCDPSNANLISDHRHHERLGHDLRLRSVGCSTSLPCHVTLKDLVVVTVPPVEVVTLMGPVVAPTGTLVVILVAVSVLMTAVVPLKVTEEAPERLVPVMVTFLPTLPLAGLNLVMVGLPSVS